MMDLRQQLADPTLALCPDGQQCPLYHGNGPRHAVRLHDGPEHDWAEIEMTGQVRMLCTGKSAHQPHSYLVRLVPAFKAGDLVDYCIGYGTRRVVILHANLASADSEFRYTVSWADGSGRTSYCNARESHLSAVQA